MKILIFNLLAGAAFCLNSAPVLAQAVTPAAPKPGSQSAVPAIVGATPGTVTLSEPKKNRNLAGSGSGYAVTETYRTTPLESIPPLVIQFSSTNQTLVQDWEEDLSVMTHILEDSLQRAANEDLADIRLGIPMIVTKNRSVRSMYLEGFGGIFMIKVNFPVVPPSKAEDEKSEHSESEWDKALQELHSRARQASWMAGNVESGADYDSDQVDTLRKELVHALKNASNFRHLTSSEYVSITVFGSPNSGKKASKTTIRRKKTDAAEALSKEASHDQATRTRSARTGTVLTLRVKKSDVDAFAKGTVDYDAFEQKVATNSYLGSGYGITSLNSWIRLAQ
jgi:hypothetical protein